MRLGRGVSWTIILTILLGVAVAASCEDACDRKPIEIASDYEFTAENGVVSGSGSVDDPYIIEGWKIDAGYHDYGIRIHGTSRPFIVRDVTISGAAKAGIFLSYVERGIIEGCEIVGNWVGITLNFASFNRITDCLLANNTEGIHVRFSGDNQILSNTIDGNDNAAIWLFASHTNEIIGNVLTGSHMGAYLDLGSEGNLLYDNSFLDNIHNAHSDTPNQWDCKQIGNYWFDYDGLDADGDGIGDSPYVINSDGDQDNYPLVATP